MITTYPIVPDMLFTLSAAILVRRTQEDRDTSVQHDGDGSNPGHFDKSPGHFDKSMPRCSRRLRRQGSTAIIDRPISNDLEVDECIGTGFRQLAVHLGLRVGRDLRRRGGCLNTPSTTGGYLTNVRTSVHSWQEKTRR